MATLLTITRLSADARLTETLGGLVTADGKITEVLTRPFDTAEAFPAERIMGCDGH